LTELRAAEIVKGFPKEEIKILKRNLARVMNT
jgi:ribosomal protein L29